MARTWPWSHGSERTRLASRLSARVRLYESITEAQSSLEQFSGMPARSAGRRWLARIGFLLQRFVLGWKWAWNCGLGARLARWRGRTKGRVRVATRASSHPVLRFPLSWRRLAAHIVLLALLLSLLLAGGLRGVLAQPVQANQGGFSLSWQWSRPAEEAAGVYTSYASIPAMPIVLQRPRLAVPEQPLMNGAEVETAAVAQRTDTITYTVQAGDTLIAIAAQFGLHIETLYWLNGLKSADTLSIDQQIRIPPADGLVYEVEEGDTLESIAEAYEVRKGNMIAYAANNLREPYELQVGQKIFVPGASKPIPRPIVTYATGRTFRLIAPAYASLPGGERFSWPALGHVTDHFGWTGSRWHTAIDIAASAGTPIYSAAAGTVVRAGWESGYGYMVAIDHGGGWETRYGHMIQQPEVTVNQWVERSQLIGFIGCTGNCTGPHVHFEIFYNGAYVNPQDYLP